MNEILQVLNFIGRGGVRAAKQPSPLIYQDSVE
jgi:hypothetical protein